ncbi:Uncharacterised protein [Vibrio cholerae]|nr:Uncharacterised protein [Vibrio cholerae]
MRLPSPEGIRPSSIWPPADLVSTLIGHEYRLCRLHPRHKNPAVFQ